MKSCPFPTASTLQCYDFFRLCVNQLVYKLSGPGVESPEPTRPEPNRAQGFGFVISNFTKSSNLQ